ncbi:unnamed protein product [Medioppia subpectinata]|uniref:Uncharacterized protein n=1 Tax=Medioppia subpectinata TaxID=1979941 RepID=A0A7R9PZN4_9ACAR|nr:unnamed protein product [Medioppia subpectinata]CAG2106640.1 unnamed protein product [Medioppia subpectinata]
MSESEAKNPTFKLVFIGDSGVGKTSLVERTVRNCFNESTDSTIGAAFQRFALKANDNITVTYNIWDTAGQERYRSLGPIYYRGSDAAILVYDITNSASFENIEFWIYSLKSVLGSHIVMALVGNKSDLEHRRVVDYKEAKHFANKNDLIFMETSAKTALNIDLILKKLSQELIKRKKCGDNVDERGIRLKLNKHNKLSIKRKCC